MPTLHAARGLALSKAPDHEQAPRLLIQIYDYDPLAAPTQDRELLNRIVHAIDEYEARWGRAKPDDG